MLDFRVLNEIRKNAKDSIKQDSDGHSIASRWYKFIFIIGFYILPLTLVFFAFWLDVRLSNLENYIGASIAIFTGLFFSLIINIGSMIRSELQNPDKDEENFKRFKETMKQIANITLYVIVHGVIIFLFMLLNSIFKMDDYPLIEQVFTGFVIFLLVRYTISLLFMLQRYSFILRDEMQNIL